MRDALRASLSELTGLSATELIEQRYAKFRSMGSFFTEP
jgi:acetyl-CoA carboxylase alpha subunit